MHALVRLAKKTVEAFVRRGEVFEPKRLTAEMKEQRGVFVSIHKIGELRGCIGTFEPQHDNVAEEIVANAISSATRDPRFPPVIKEELKQLDYSIDVLSKPEPVKSQKQLDPKRYGVIVETDDTVALSNMARIDDRLGHVMDRPAIIIVNGYFAYLPIVRR